MEKNSNSYCSSEGKNRPDKKRSASSQKKCVKLQCSVLNHLIRKYPSQESTKSLKPKASPFFPLYFRKIKIPKSTNYSTGAGTFEPNYFQFFCKKVTISIMYEGKKVHVLDFNIC